jgi:penicillin-binding protein 1A
MTVRLAQAVGMDKVVATAIKFGIVDKMIPTLAMAIGSGETTALRLVTAYAEIVNGGKKIEPTLIDRVQDRHGVTIFRHDVRPCDQCQADGWANQAPPALPDKREQLVDAPTAYQIVSMLEGVVQRGTGVAVRAVGKPLGGKTGTTNDSNDTWFVGFSPDLAVGVYLGFDAPRSLGPKEYGGVAAAPIFRDFMIAALKDAPATGFRTPPGMRLYRVSAATGLPAGAGEAAIYEAYKPGTEPGQNRNFGLQRAPVDDETPLASTGDSGAGMLSPPRGAPASGTGGLY